MKIFDATLTTLEQSLDVRLVEHNVLAGNVANVDTTGYKPKELDFSAAMAAARASAGGDTMSATEPNHMGANGGTISDPSRVTELAASMISDGRGTTNPSFDGNGVDLDRTMAGMAENSLQYGASARAASKKLAILRYATDGGS
jgi:flagellar basal-body rod protein FlgB